MDKKGLMDIKELPVYLQADVVVCGGGTAGVFAAVAAAKEGASVLLVEALGGLGGSAVNGLVLPMMRVYMTEEPRCSYLHQDMMEHLEAYLPDRINENSFDPLILGAVLEQMCTENGVDILLDAVLCDVATDNGAIHDIAVMCQGGVRRISGRVFIDCTGDGILSVLAGAEYEAGAPGSKINQPMSLRYLLGGVDKKQLGQFFDSLKDPNTAQSGKDGKNLYADVTNKRVSGLTPFFEKAIEAGELVYEDMVYWQLFDVPGRTDGVALNNPEFFEYTDACDPKQLTQIHLKGKQIILRQLNFYKKYFPGCENAYVSNISAMVGVRESRRILGEYELTGEDLLEQKKFEDAISQANYPVDVHGMKELYRDDRPHGDTNKPWYEIPFRCLVVKGFDNLLTAGRCISSDFIAQSAVRIQICCHSTGEAAGIAAAMSIQNAVSVKEIKGQEVRARMQKLGAAFV